MRNPNIVNVRIVSREHGSRISETARLELNGRTVEEAARQHLIDTVGEHARLVSVSPIIGSGNARNPELSNPRVSAGRNR
jgi:hypothetical protein